MVCSVNCEWYRRFCADHMRQRSRYKKPRTFIKRCDTIKALKRMMNGDKTTIYAQRLNDVANELIRQWSME